VQGPAAKGHQGARSVFALKDRSSDANRMAGDGTLTVASAPPPVTSSETQLLIAEGISTAIENRP
jgi:hypothetical protein